MHQQREMMDLPLTSLGCRQQIGEIEGGMLPIVTPSEEEGDKRKHKKLHWQEARLAMVHEEGSKVVIVPMDNLSELANIPPSVLGNTDIPFYQNNQMLMQKAILLD